MIFADIDHQHSVPTIDAAEWTEHRAPSKFAVLDESKEVKPLTFTLRKSILQIEAGRLNLRLRQPPKILVHPDGRTCEVVGWGVIVPTAKAEEIPSEMARRFLDLFSKADGGWLNRSDQEAWVEILDQIDYQAFCIDRAHPHYMEGEITSVNEQFVWVEWHDGNREKLNGSTRRSLAHLRKGDSFGADVKLGRENQTRSIENLMLLNDRPSIELSA